MYPAKNGDAFLVEIAGHYVLIDAGYASTFRDEIAPDLSRLHSSGARLSLAVCTHIDADHIGGMIEFVSSNGPRGARHIIDVEEVWHNSLRSLPNTMGALDTKADQQLLQAIRRRGFAFPTGSSPALNPIGARQGSSLAQLLKRFDYQWNGGNGTQCMQAQDAPMALPGGVEMQIIGPRRDRLEALRNWWLGELRRLSYRGSGKISDLIEDAYEMWLTSAEATGAGTVRQIADGLVGALEQAHAADTSLTNGSSIAFVLRGQGTSILFLGDAWAEDIVSHIKVSSPSQVVFDAIKVAHHGSRHNSSVELLQHVDAPCFLISSDGSRHGHPDFEVLAEIVDRPAPFKRHIYFNYETPAARRLETHTSRSHVPFSVHIAENDWINIGGRRDRGTI